MVLLEPNECLVFEKKAVKEFYVFKKKFLNFVLINLANSFRNTIGSYTFWSWDNGFFYWSNVVMFWKVSKAGTMFSIFEKFRKFWHVVVKFESFNSHFPELRSECPIVSTFRSEEVLYNEIFRGLNQKCDYIVKKELSVCFCILVCFWGQLQQQIANIWTKPPTGTVVSRCWVFLKQFHARKLLKNSTNTAFKSKELENSVSLLSLDHSEKTFFP